MRRGDGRHGSESAGKRNSDGRPFGRIGNLAGPLRHNQRVQRWIGGVRGVNRTGIYRIQRDMRRRHESKAIVLVQRRLTWRMVAGDFHPLTGPKILIVWSGVILLDFHAH